MIAFERETMKARKARSTNTISSTSYLSSSWALLVSLGGIFAGLDA